MKKLLLGLLLITGFIAKAQEYNNEWIDYSKTYYKFKIGKTGLYRISQTVLSSTGLGSTPAEYFQLWRNGTQIPIYTSVATGSLPASGYIEFWGEMNDGKPDRQLYRNPEWQLNDKWSLETDTASYFLTVNSDISANLRLVTTANNVSGTTLTPDVYFMYTAGNYFKNRLNPGFALKVGEYLYSSSYDKGEGYTSAEIVTTFSNCVPTYGVNTFTFPNLRVYKGPSAPEAKFKIAVSGNEITQRRFLAKINTDSILSNSVDFFNYSIDSTYFSVNTLNGTSDKVLVYNYTNVLPVGCPANDRMVVHKYEITYPRTFDFNAQTSFEFTLAANAAGNYLRITNFKNGSSTPVLYDLTNGKRYLADLSSTPALKFVLEPSLTDRNLVLVNEDAANINLITTLQPRNFINYTDASNHGDYIIISSPVLFAGAGGSNPVEEYRAYRSSAAGGNYSAKIYLADEIIDQFGFGIKKNPGAIRNFIRYARNNFAITPRHVFIIGRGMMYTAQRTNESNPDVEKLNLVPTFGSPASDVLLVAEPGSSQPNMSIGRLSAINAAEVAVYLNKVKSFEQVQAVQSPLIQDKAWMKNVVHIVGASDEALDSTLSSNLSHYRAVIRDTLFGANVTSFNKTSPDGVSQLNSSVLNKLFTDGISLITYFGHSSATTMEFNLDNPLNYNNYQKYPLFIAMGCNAGAFFGFSNRRLELKETISENYVLAPDRGTIGFIASTHFGIVQYLDVWAERAYKQISYKSYGRSIGEILAATAADVFADNTQDDFYARCNIEQTGYNGDPAIRLNPHAKPDYVIEDSMVRVSPSFISVAESSFNVTANFLNIGKSPDSSVVLEIKRELPDKSVVLVRRDTIPGIRYTSTVTVDVPIDPIKDKGLNTIIFTIDPDNNIDELFENNNSVRKDVMIYEDEAKTIYPYNFAIINKQNIKLVASTANPFASEKQYTMELDTTELFTSPTKVVKNITSKGGVLEFDPGIIFRDSTVYYWRVASTDSSNWSTSSFVYLANSDLGFNQSHYFQHMKSDAHRMFLDSASRSWISKPVVNNLYIRNGVWTMATGQEADLVVNVNYNSYIRNTCNYGIIFNVFDKNTFKPWRNDLVNGQGLYNSLPPNCAESRRYNFEFNNDTAGRRKALEFLRLVPEGNYIVIRNQPRPNAAQNEYVDRWINDETIYGQGNSLYNELKANGVNIIDSFYRLRTYAAVYKKSSPQFTPAQVASNNQFDVLILTVDCLSSDSLSFAGSVQFGPAKHWKEMRWMGKGESKDNTSFDIIGVRMNGTTDSLFTDVDGTLERFNISSIDANTYPYLRLQVRNVDTANFTPYQLQYWQLTCDPAPEGALNPNAYFQMKDTVEIGEPLVFKAAFKNVSETVFSDSLKIKALVTDKNNVTHTWTWKQRPLLLSPDTIYITYPISTRSLTGPNTMFIEVNPNDDQPEQYHFNNSFYKSFYVKGDTLNPLLDVTFDNIHILNGDIVSSKPNILIKLTDEARWNVMDDPSKIKVQLRKLPKGNDQGFLRDYQFGGDTLQFIAAGQPPANNNTASAVFRPQLADGEYELIVTGTDMSDNKAGAMEYRVAFEVINKPMISNMLNYPNPFTTSTAFVFTLTGSDVPQNIRIQILTVTGKVVREITKEELGPIHIGRNITEFKWNGTDQYGQRLANGVYLYRVLTNLNNKSLEHYKDASDDTDKYFTKGYGKMYLMR